MAAALAMALAVAGCADVDHRSDVADVIAPADTAAQPPDATSGDAGLAGDALADTFADTFADTLADTFADTFADTAATAWPDAAASAPTPAGPSWQPVGSAEIDASGHSLPLQVTVSSADRFVALRIRPAEPDPSAPWCFGLDEVKLPDGTVWLGPLDGGGGASNEPFGSQRALPQHGYGIFVLPNDGVSALPNGPLSFRVVLRDCRYDVPATRTSGGAQPGSFAALPTAVLVEVARESAITADAAMRLELRLAIGASSGFPTAALPDNPDWNAALLRLRALFATAGVTIEIGRTAVVDLPQVISYGPGKRQMLDAAWDKAMNALTDDLSERALRFVPVVLVGCLVRDAPVAGGPQEYAGQTARIPGGAPFGTSANGVFLARSACISGGAPLAGEEWGAVLAHELGHHLGLLHTTTPLSAQRSREGFVDIMGTSGSLLSAQGFSAAQRAALRRHVDVVQ